MKTVLIDCRFAALPVGLGRYTRELVTGLKKRRDSLRYRFLVRSQQEPWLQQADISIDETIHAPYAHYSIGEQWALPGLIRNSKADLLFSPHFNVPLRNPLPSVITVHDLILHRYPNKSSIVKQAAYRYLMKRAVDTARAIIAVSTFTAQEVVSVYGASMKQKLTVIHEGVGELFHRADPLECRDVLKSFGVEGEYFLYVGNAKEHKNVELLLRAYAVLPSPRPSLLLVTGGREAERLTLPPGARILSDVSDSALPALYSAAQCFVTASLYEGYCLPIAEALACGCPVIAVNRTAIPETARGHAILVEPDQNLLASALSSTFPTPSPVRVGNWAKTATETAAVLTRVLETL